MIFLYHGAQPKWLDLQIETDRNRQKGSEMDGNKQKQSETEKMDRCYESFNRLGDADAGGLVIKRITI